MATQSSKPSPGDATVEAGSREDTIDTIAAQDRARAEANSRAMKLRLPWIGAGAIVLGYFIWRKRR